VTVVRKGEFEEIAHSGGRVTFSIVTNPEEPGRGQYQTTWSGTRPVPSALFAVWALSQGVAVADIDVAGIGVPWNPPPVAGCIPVFIASDSEGNFGNECPACGGYWRSRASPVMCPYCATRAYRHQFLTRSQKRYVKQYCDFLHESFDKGDGDHVIDLDAVADAVGNEGEKPQFYYAEESQQKRFHCDACGGFNDILGRFCYCSICGTRNDLHELRTVALAQLRSQANSGGGYEKYVSDAVGAFDTFAGQFAKQLVQLVPLRPGRKARLERMRFHNLNGTTAEFKSGFDIDILEGLKPDDVQFAQLMFHRRHVYEHNGGVVDEKYMNDSGDTSVRLGQAIRETQASAHRLIGLVEKMAENLHRGFHEIFPPEQQPIKWHRARGERIVG
jgi:hypothetical protein